MVFGVFVNSLCTHSSIKTNNIKSSNFYKGDAFDFINYMQKTFAKNRKIRNALIMCTFAIFRAFFDFSFFSQMPKMHRLVESFAKKTAFLAFVTH